MNYLYDFLGYGGNQPNPQNVVGGQNHGAGIHGNAGMVNHEYRGGNPGNRVYGGNQPNPQNVVGGQNHGAGVVPGNAGMVNQGYRGGNPGNRVFYGNQPNPQNVGGGQNHGAAIPGNAGMVNHGYRGGNPGNRGGGQNHGNNVNRGGNPGNRGGNQGNRGGNQGVRDGMHENTGHRDGNQGNRGGNHGNRAGNHGNRGGNHGNRGGNQGGNPHRDNHEIWRNGGENRGHRGNRNDRRRGDHNPRPEMPNMDWFNLRQRDVSEDRRSQHSQHSYQGNAPLRRDYGGRYGSTASLNQEEPHRRNHDRDQNDRRGRGRGGHFRSGMGFKKLEEMCNLEPDKLVISLTNENAGLEKLFEHDLSNDYIVLILRVITRLCESAFNQNKAQVLSTLCEQKFVDKLSLYLADLALHDKTDKWKNKYFWQEQERFWNDILIVFENILKIIPNRGCDVLPKLVKRTCMTVADIEREQHCTVPTVIKERLEEIQAKIMLSVEEREKRQTNKFIPENDEEPPDDFRQISLYPTVYEITNNREQVFLRQNIVQGKYNSVDHYLDVQFRLLREDFVGPLRNGVCDYLHQMRSKEHKRIFNVHIYKDVLFVKKQTIQDKVVLVIQLPAMRKKIKLENTRRFMYGSLVCFTSDNFRTIIFGTVASRDKNLIEIGQIAVDILENKTVDNTVPYIMIECSVFFEPYYHVLKALQMMSEDKFPLKRYIIDVEPDVRAPSYYKMLSEIEHQNHKFFPLILHTWPSYIDFGLDPSQFRAFQAALTKEFCVIQGPPGTGKTFIGLKVAQVLLENREHWNENGSPILVICFTNHALDQFLEGILRYTKKLVRIGGQSKSETLKGFNIREARTKGVRTRTRDSAQLLMKRRWELKDYMTQIHSHTTLLDAIQGGDGIINFKNFEVIDDQLRNSWFSRARANEILDWLLGGRNADERYEERRRNRLAQLQAQLEHNENQDGDVDSDEDFYDAEAEEEREVDDRDDIVIKTEFIDKKTFTLKTFADYEDLIVNLERVIATIEMKVEQTNEISLFDEKGVKEEELMKTRNDLEYFRYRMDQFKANNAPPRPLLVDYANPLILTPNERWGLYFHWLNLYRRQLAEDLTILDEKYRTVYRQYEEVRQIEDTQVMREMLVIGMTTSGAARYQSLLQALKCPIVIVEEAAEVLESHVVVSLTDDCKHLILIGDHQQLRPTTAEYKIAKRYNLEISLFERMVKNNIHCVQLEVQHRMRPEIAQLIVPSIYPKLDNHHTVESYPPVQGVTKNLFFITHKEAEENMADTGSKRNIHEARFLIKLARHFILQGYEPQEITILATYSGQMFCLWKERRQYNMLKDVRITVVDNFQGEESKIILLSLVRSNEDENVGFLKIDNRVCVALSRAKEGMYIMGNIDILEKSSEVWRQIKAVLEKNNQLGTHLTLQCQVHPDQLTRVAKVEDFNRVIEGGCSQLCNKQLNCGHICSSLCHITDRQHELYKCKEKCRKVLCELDHPCPDRCFVECKPCMVPMLVTLKCAHTHSLPCHMQDTTQFLCPTQVEVVLDCEHRANKPCHQDIKTFACPHPCDIRIRNCGHACTRRCHINDDPDHLKMKCYKQCERPKANCSVGNHLCPLRCHEECKPCEVKIDKKRSCGHMHKVECSINVEEVECNRRCNKKLDCGHNCKQKCGEPCGNCNEKVSKVVPECNHTIKKMKCSDIPDRSKCDGKCTLTLSCGHPCNKKCRERCQTKCEYLVDNPYPAACGHQFKIPCHKAKTNLESNSYNLLQHCSEPCNALLLCEHRCSGTCGTCAQGRVHATCREQCGKTLVCGHECTIPCKEMCQPCTKRCSYRCAHNKCGQKCGEPCKPCMEPCTRRCIHLRCSMKCGQICDIPPCTAPCHRKLKCGHPCIGFCGDPCPPVCRVCNPDDETFMIMFGNEDEPDARFVYLEECKHVIEAEAMDNWLNQVQEGENKQINVKHCPKCKTTLAFTQRYSTFIKEAYTDINNIKVKWFGQEQQNEESRLQLQIRIAEVKNINRNLYIQSSFLRPRLHDLQNELKEKHKGKRNPLNIIAIISVTSQLGLIENLVDVFTNGNLDEHRNLYEACVERMDYILDLMHNKDGRISKQRASDIETEINRFERFIQLCTIEKNPNFKPAAAATPNIKTMYNKILNSLNSIEKYSETTDKSMKIFLKDLAEVVDKSMTITDQERREIVAALQKGTSKESGLGQGRWFKCPNGHYFAIGACGGAMEVAKCFECGEKIGGQNHALISTNTFAGEMDGAAHPAWSDAANMGNYRFEF